MEHKQPLEEELRVPHQFSLGKSFLIWLGISVLAALLVAISSGLYSDGIAVFIIVIVLSTIITTISLYINWITTSLFFFLGFKIGKNDVTYRSVLYYYMKNAWIYAAWIGVLMICTLIFGGSFITTIPGAILTFIALCALYFLILRNLKKDFTIRWVWIYYILAALFIAVMIATLIYTGSDAFDASLDEIRAIQ